MKETDKMNKAENVGRLKKSRREKLLASAYVCTVTAAVLLFLGLRVCLVSMYKGSLGYPDDGPMYLVVMLLPGFFYISALLICIMQAELMRRKTFGYRESRIRLWLSIIFIIVTLIFPAGLFISNFSSFNNGEAPAIVMFFALIYLIFTNYGVGFIQIPALFFLLAVIVKLGKAERAEQAELAERAEQAELAERAEQAELAERAEQAELAERAEQAELAERAIEAETEEKAETTKLSAAAETAGKDESTGTTETAGKDESNGTIETAGKDENAETVVNAGTAVNSGTAGNSGIAESDGTAGLMSEDKEREDA